MLFFFVFLYSDKRGSFFLTPFQMKGVALSHWSLIFFQMYNFKNFIFPFLHFHSSSICTTPIFLQIKMREKTYSKICTKVDVNFSSNVAQCASQAIRCTLYNNTRGTCHTSWHHDCVSSPHDSIIILVKINVKSKIIFAYVLEHCAVNFSLSLKYAGARFKVHPLRRCWPIYLRNEILATALGYISLMHAYIFDRILFPFYFHLHLYAPLPITSRLLPSTHDPLLPTSITSLTTLIFLTSFSNFPSPLFPPHPSLQLPD